MHPDLNRPNEPTSDARLLAGKYRNAEELEKGYTELQRLSNETYQRLQTLEARLGDMDRMNPTEQANKRRAAEILDEVGVPVDALAELIREEQQKFFAPMMAAQEARTAVSREFPDFQSKEEKVASFLEGNSTLKARYQKLYAADPAGAMEWAYSTYSRMTDTPHTEDTRTDGRLPAMSGGESRSVDSYVQSQEMEKLVERARATGDWSQVVAARLNVPDSHFDAYNPYKR